MKKTAIIGFGCAGFKAAETLRKNDPGMQIDIFSDTDLAPYNPMLTTYYLSKKIGWDALFPFGSLENITQSLDLHFHARSRVRHLNCKERIIETESGTFGPYDDVIISSGAFAVVPDYARDIPAVFAMRTISDVCRLEAALSAENVKTAIVAGAQMVGIKVAEMLKNRGVDVLLTGRSPQVFPRSAFQDIAKEIEKRIDARGIGQFYGVGLNNISECTDGLICRFADGSERQADICCICTGIRANIPFVHAEELETSTGINVDLRMQTSVPHIYAAGDCCNTYDIQTKKNGSIGLWANAFNQGECAALNILGGQTQYGGNLNHNITHFMDMDFISIGDSRLEGEHVKWKARDGSWQIEASVSPVNDLLCLNILDNAGVSGPFKAFAVNRFNSGFAELTDIEKMQIMKSGMSEEFLDFFCRKVGGK